MALVSVDLSERMSPADDKYYYGRVKPKMRNCYSCIDMTLDDRTFDKQCNTCGRPCKVISIVPRKLPFLKDTAIILVDGCFERVRLDRLHCMKFAR